MTERQAESVAAIVGPSHGLETGSYHYIPQFHRLLQENQAENMAAIAGSSHDLQAGSYHFIPQLHRMMQDTPSNEAAMNGNPAEMFHMIEKLQRRNSDTFMVKRRGALKKNDVKKESKLASLDVPNEVIQLTNKTMQRIAGNEFLKEGNVIKSETNPESAIEDRGTGALNKIASFIDLKVVKIGDPPEEMFQIGQSGILSSQNIRLGAKKELSVIPEENVHNSPICGSCGHGSLIKEHGLCKDCYNKMKKDLSKPGALDEFKAYAQSIARSVRNMLDILPKKQTDKEVPIQEKSDLILHRFNTDMPCLEGKGRGLFNRSLSYDCNIQIPGKILKPSDSYLAATAIKPCYVYNVDEISQSNIRKVDSNFSLISTKSDATRLIRKVKRAKVRSKTQTDMKKTILTASSESKQLKSRREQSKLRLKNVKNSENIIRKTLVLKEGTPVDPPTDSSIRLISLHTSSSEQKSVTKTKALENLLNSSKSGTSVGVKANMNRNVSPMEVSSEFRRRCASYDGVTISRQQKEEIRRPPQSGEKKYRENETRSKQAIVFRQECTLTNRHLPSLQYNSQTVNSYSDYIFYANNAMPSERKQKLSSETYCSGIKYLPAELMNQLSVKEEQVNYQKMYGDDPLAIVTDTLQENKVITKRQRLNSVRSCHSDESLKTCQIEVYYSKKLNGETDVDTGISKRYIPRTHASRKSTYAASTDLSTSGSSISGTSSKSDANDSIYTGGFYRSDPFYDHDCNGDSFSVIRASSGSQIYFEPSHEDQKSESAESEEIYTGEVFSKAHNANGSMNNSTRLLHNRVYHRSKRQPKIDFVCDSNMEITGVNPFKTTTIFYLQETLNYSNNSSNGQYYNYAGEEHQTPNPRITLSDSSAYTGFAFHYQSKPSQQNKTDYKGHMDFSKYDMQETVNTGFFFQTPRQILSDEIWYRGPFMTSNIPPSTLEHQVDYPTSKFHQPNDDDDCYTNIICPKFKNNNNNSNDDLNNNYFYNDDYNPKPPEKQESSSSGFYDEASSFYSPSNSFFLKSGSNIPQLPPNPVPQEECAYSGSSPQKTYMSGGFYGQADSTYTPPFGFKNIEQRVPNETVSRPERKSFYSSNDNDSSWGGYEPKKRSPTGDYIEMPRNGKFGSAEKDNYFEYASNRNPASGFFTERKGECFHELDEERMSPIVPVMNEIKKVGGIVCRENVANKEDYAEDVNRDLLDEPGAWVSYKYRDDEPKFVKELGGGSRGKLNGLPAKETANKLVKTAEESSYAHNQLYDNVGTRNWREMNQDQMAKVKETKETVKAKQPPVKAEKKERAGGVRRPVDIIPDKAMGNRLQPVTKPATIPTTPVPPPIPPTLLDGNNNTSQPARNSSSTKNTLPKSPKKKVNRSEEAKLPTTKKTNLEKETKKASNAVVVDEMVFIPAPKLSKEGSAENLETKAWKLKSDTLEKKTSQEKCSVM